MLLSTNLTGFWGRYRAGVVPSPRESGIGDKFARLRGLYRNKILGELRGSMELSYTKLPHSRVCRNAENLPQTSLLLTPAQPYPRGDE